MAEDKSDAREVTWRHLFPWTELFRGFQIALDVNKLLLAAAGILFMALGWWLLSFLFGAGYSSEPPILGAPEYTGITDLNEQWKRFKADRDSWNLMHEAANIGRGDKAYEAEDLARSEDERKAIKAAYDAATKAKDEYEKALQKARADYEKALKGAEAKEPETAQKLEQINKALQAALLSPPDSRAVFLAALEKENKDIARARAERMWRLLRDTAKPAGTLSIWPWSEDRGPNPFLLVTGQVRQKLWEPNHFWEWFTSEQLPVMIEPLVKLVRPMVYFFSPRANTFLRFYFLLVTIWTIIVWSIFGGAITRIAAVQIARGEKIGLGEAVRFTSKRLLSYVSAPLFPLAFVLFLLIFTVIYGWFFMIPILGDILLGGLFWPVPLIIGLIMAVTLVGLAVGWPLMAPTISTEGTDSWEAVSRSYSYVFQRPWQYVWYGLVGISYGAVVVFFIGFMGSFTVYMSKWAVNQTPGIKWTGRDPSFLFVYSPTSFGWRNLLLQGVTVDGKKIVSDETGEIDEVVYRRYLGDKDREGKVSPDALAWYNKAGAMLVALWLGLLFLMLVGFGYSFFWSISTIIYLLMRRNVDAAELDEVYLEEDEQEGVPGAMPAPPPAPAPAPAAKPGQSPLTMVEPPTLRPPSPVQAPAAPPAPPPSPAPSTSLTLPTPAPLIPPAPEKPAAPAPESSTPASATAEKPEKTGGGNGPDV